jgi:hypothetical protein
MSEPNDTTQDVVNQTEVSEIEWCDTTKLKAVVSKGMFVDGGSCFEKSWPKHKVEGGCCASSKWGPCKPIGKLEVSSLRKLLESRWRCPAYLLSYAPPAMPYRLSEGVFEQAGALGQIGGSLTMQLFLVDVDAPGHGEGGEPAVAAWFETERPRLEKLRERHGCLVYRSKGGYRILGVLKRPFTIKSNKQVLDWKRRYMAWLNYMAREFLIGTTTPVDELVDWQRLQRVPHDLRSEDGKPEEREVIGDTDRIGYWDPPLADEDHEWAANQIRDKRIGSKGKKYPKKVPVQPYEGKTMLRLLLEDRGLLGEEAEPGKWNVICPLEDQHSKPNPGEADNDTILFEKGGRLGNLYCSHAGCGHARYELADWLRQFDDASIATAKKQAGVGTSARDSQDPAFRVNDPRDWTEVAEVISKNLPRYVSYQDRDYLWAGSHYEVQSTTTWHARLRQLSAKLWSTKEDDAGNEVVVPFHPWSGSDKEIAIALKARPGALQDPERFTPFALDAGVPNPDDLIYLTNMWVNWWNENEYEPTDGIFVVNTLNAGWKSISRSGKCRHWLAFLHCQWKDDPESIALLQEWFGALICRQKQYQKFFYLKGVKCSGKGAIIRLLLLLLGESATTFQNGALNDKFDLEDFIDRDVAICPDAVWSRAADSTRTLGVYLQMAGNDRVKANRKNKIKVWLRQLIMMLASNELPSLKDTSSALLRRLSYLETTVSFEGREDRLLEGRLASELEGIVRWGIEGARRLIQNGCFTQPKYHATVLAEIEEACSPPVVFFNRSTEWGQGYSVEMGELQSAYAASTAASNTGQYGSEQLGKALKAYAATHGHNVERVQKRIGGVRRWVYEGFRLVADAQVISTTDMENVRKWIADPKEVVLDEIGHRVCRDFSGSAFRISDVLTHAMDVQKARQPQEENRVRRVLAALGYVVDEDGLMLFPGRHLSIVKKDDDELEKFLNMMP